MSPETSQSFEDRSSPSDETISRLLQLAGHRPPIPEWDTAVVKRAARAEWQKKVTSRRRRTLYRRVGGFLAAAAVLLVALGLWLIPTGPDTSLQVATFESGAVTAWNARGSESTGPALGDAIFAGTSVETAQSRAAFRLADGTSVRLDSRTRLRWLSETAMELDHGAVYLDSGPSAGGLEVRTPLGIARDVGTQFEVRYPSHDSQEASLRIRVREGLVALSRNGDVHEIEPGVELEVQPDGRVERREVPVWGSEWSWVLEAAPVTDFRGRLVREYLEWAAREQGWQLRFDDDEAEQRANETNYTADTDASESSLELVLLGTTLSYRLQDGELQIYATR